ncbi:arylesterase [Undibacterium sp. SXout11W]|uniref:arylesterase n=1 Tax=Undibacterium sp. SXout11W TaxID=3413050 RepID=UPI003BF31DB2
MLSFLSSRQFMLRVLLPLLMSSLMPFAYAHSASKSILVLGDSLSAEYGLVRGQGWVSLMEKKLAESNPNSTVINASISGETTSGGKTRLPALVNKLKPDIVIIELGGNDALRGLSLAASEENFRAMIVAAKKANAEVLLVGMKVPPNYGKEYTQNFFSLYAKLAKEQKVRLAPFLLEGIAERDDLFQADRIHPIANAHALMLNNVWPQLAPLLTK